MRPLAAIVGRANVGKSTLFNRLIGERKAIVSETPGTTRDRIYEEISWNGKEFNLVDTGGILFDQKELYEKDIINQAEEAIRFADLILFLVDIKEGLLPIDQKVLERVRKTNKKIILVANKADNQKLQAEAQNLANLGLGSMVSISAIHGTGTGDLLDEIVKQLKVSKITKERNKEKLTKVAIVGRPNVGKSSLFNKLIGKNRAIVSDIPGTTRDVINTEIKIDQKNYLFLDTAGLRRRTKIKKQIEYYSVLRTLRAIEQTDIVLFIIDVEEGVARQDLHIISNVVEQGKGLILIINKWDKIKFKEEDPMGNYISYLQEKMRFLSWMPVIFTSAKTGKKLSKISELLQKVSKEREKRVKIKKLNIVISKAILEKPPPRGKKGQMKIFYTSQAKGFPPTFVLFVRNKEALKKSYLNYLENQIRDEFGFTGVPIKIILKSKK
jgi:GTP-binding protein